MSKNICAICNAAKPDIGKCPVCNEWTKSKGSSSVPTNTTDQHDGNAEPKNSGSGGCYGCLIPIILVILTVTCGKSPKSYSPSSQQSTRPQVSEPSFVQQSPPAPEPQRMVQIRPSTAHTNDPVCSACGQNHLLAAQPISESSSVSSSASETKPADPPTSQSGGSWDKADFLRRFNRMKSIAEGTYKALGPGAALQNKDNDLEQEALEHGYQIQWGDPMASDWSGLEPILTKRGESDPRMSFDSVFGR